MKRITAKWLTDPRAQAVCRMLSRAGHKAYFVGGCVRNELLSATISDIDLATDATPEQVVQLANSNGLNPVPTGIEHGTVTVVSGGLPCEVTTFRTDIETDGRRAIVRFSTSLQEDAKRRDFTMNALYADQNGNVIDPLHGLPDLLARRVRFIENAQARIREDYLRTLRFFRFHAWYGDPDGGLDPDGLAAIAANLGGLETLSKERVGHEMLKLLAAPNPAQSMASMQHTGVLARILPGADTKALAVLVHVEGLTGTAPDPLRRLASLGQIKDAKDRLRLSRKHAKRLRAVTDLIGGIQNAAEMSYRFGADIARDVVLLRTAMLEQPVPKNLESDLSHGAAAHFPVTASDIADKFEGAALGKRLRQLETAWIASNFTLSRQELLAWSR